MGTSSTFTVSHRDPATHARIGTLTTAHGIVHTPAFVPVGTFGMVKSLTPQDLFDVGVEMYFVNTYHTYLRPGLEIIGDAGGIHAFTTWDRAIITDSGGFQIFSLGRRKGELRKKNLHAFDHDAPLITRIREEGITFRSHWDGTEYQFSPEVSIRAQRVLGSDIVLAFDDCVQYPCSYGEAKDAMDRTHRWLVRSIDAFRQSHGSTRSLLYGIVQGGVFEELRFQSASYISSLAMDGVAIGGVSVGESKAEMDCALTSVVPRLDPGLPRHVLGVGTIEDIIPLIGLGADTFDCVEPTRRGRMGYAFLYPHNLRPTQQRMIELSSAIFARDTSPIDPTCPCITCKTVTRAYLHHCFKIREPSVVRLVSIHNLTTMKRYVDTAKHQIEQGIFGETFALWMRERHISDGFAWGERLGI